MHALNDFFTTDYGLMSLVVLAIVLFMLGWYVRYFLKHIAEDTARYEAEQRAQAQASKS